MKQEETLSDRIDILIEFESLEGRRMYLHGIETWDVPDLDIPEVMPSGEADCE